MLLLGLFGHLNAEQTTNITGRFMIVSGAVTASGFSNYVEHTIIKIDTVTGHTWRLGRYDVRGTNSGPYTAAWGWEPIPEDLERSIRQSSAMSDAISRSHKRN